MAIQNGDFVELEYTGKVKEDEQVFDTTDAKKAQEHDVFNPNSRYGALTIVVGEGQLIRGLDEQLVGKEAGKEYTIEVAAEKAFGKRNAKKLQLIPTNRFKKEGINPMPGLQVNVDNVFGVVRSVSGGRTIVDFNHPLASKDVVYEVSLKKVVTDTQQMAQAYLGVQLGLTSDMCSATVKEGKATIELPIELPEPAAKKLTDDIKRLIPKIKEVSFAVKKIEKKAEKPQKA